MFGVLYGSTHVGLAQTQPSSFPQRNYNVSSPLQPTPITATITDLEDEPKEDSAGEGEKKDEEVDFLDLNIEQLRKTTVAPAFETTVTTVSRQESTVGQSPAAVFVITQEMIQRSGVRSIPEALRLAPGVQVARIDSNKWAIGVRGITRRFGRNLLVQIDGRSVYTPLFSGVFWDEQNLLLEDVERIEVIRGPGATVWGANAVNGVINVITKSAKDTVGSFTQIGGGTYDQGFASYRVGGSGDEGRLHWRAWTSWFERDAGFVPGSSGADDWRQWKFGFRSDWEFTDVDSFTFDAQFLDGASGTRDFSPPATFVVDDAIIGNGHVLGRWTHKIDKERDWSVQVYWDHVNRQHPWILNIVMDTFDIDYQNRFPVGDRHKVVWGLGYRLVHDILVSPPGSRVTLNPQRRQFDIYGGFIQDEMELIDEKLFFTLGTKLQTNSFTGFEVQPSARMLWAIDERHATWIAFSRAVRTPSRVTEEGRVGLGGPLFIFSNSSLASEDLMAYEFGYRAQPVDRFSWDATLFFNDYHNIVGAAVGGPSIQFDNTMAAEAYGTELTMQYALAENWRLSSTYSFVQVQVHSSPFGIESETQFEGSTPHNMATLQSSWDLCNNMEFDVIGRYVDNLPAVTTPRYLTMDLRFAWQANKHLELSIVGQNLLEAAHKEFADLELNAQFTNVQRSVYGALTWRY